MNASTIISTVTPNPSQSNKRSGWRLSVLVPQTQLFLRDIEVKLGTFLAAFDSTLVGAGFPGGILCPTVFQEAGVPFHTQGVAADAALPPLTAGPTSRNIFGHVDCFKDGSIDTWQCGGEQEENQVNQGSTNYPTNKVHLYSTLLISFKTPYNLLSTFGKITFVAV